MLKEIDKLAWLYVKDKQVLMARSKGKDIYYLPGGKREVGESDKEALVREIHEELSVELTPDSIEYFNTFKAQADGKAEGVIVKMTCYQAEYTGKIVAASEIEEVTWLNYKDKHKGSAATKLILEHLKKNDWID
ncbi:NUDIX hydrolase [Photobacterium indicum]|uniref:NUDIX hydrolase n=1 Tax=Photobacterium indicum TaxID=81447 RepID=UPI003D0DAF28